MIITLAGALASSFVAFGFAANVIEGSFKNGLIEKFPSS